MKLKKPALSDKATTWLFLAPTSLIVIIAVVAPLFYSLFLSFHRYRLIEANARPTFIGLTNYINVFQDHRFWDTGSNTVIFAVSSVLIAFVLGTILAMMLSGDSKATRITISLLLIPMIMAPVAAGNMWRMMLDRTTGVVNYLMMLVGMSPIPFLGDPRYALPTLILVDVWRITPWVTLLLASGLKGIPSSTVEAAVVDGAGRFYIFRKVIIPQLYPVMVVVFMIRFIDSFRVFDLVFVMTGGGPGTSTMMLPNFIYNQGLGAFNIGYSAALAFVFIMAMSVLATIFLIIRHKVIESTK